MSMGLGVYCPVLGVHHQDTSRCVPMGIATGHRCIRCMGMCRLVLVAYARTPSSTVQPNVGCSRSVCCTTAWADKVYVEIYIYMYIFQTQTHERKGTEAIQDGSLS